MEPTVDMNPILLKPEADNRSQVVVMGKPLGTLSAREYFTNGDRLWAVVTQSLERLLAEYDVLVIEGAGSPAEVNLKDNDIVNMRVALQCDAPVLLVADIDRGGVFASIVGTLELLEPEERALVKAFVINKFRGDLSLLSPGLEWLEDRTGIPVAGVIPYYHHIHIAEEDSVSLEKRRQMKGKDSYLLDIAVIGLPHISNFDDFDPLGQEEVIRLRYVEANDPLEDPDLIILPGTKSTVADLAELRHTGLAEAVISRSRAGTPIIGICGGYQMMGQHILDPEHVESRESQVDGLGLLPVTTTFFPVKSTHQIRGQVADGHGLLNNAVGLPLTGYEIHTGQTTGNRLANPFRILERSGKACEYLDGCVDRTGNVIGTYIHGLFHNEALRRSILGELAAREGIPLQFEGTVSSSEEQYDKLAAIVRGSLDMRLVYELMGLARS